MVPQISVRHKFLVIWKVADRNILSGRKDKLLQQRGSKLNKVQGHFPGARRKTLASSLTI